MPSRSPERGERVDDFWKVTAERLSAFRLEHDAAVVFERKAAKSVPLWLIQPPGADWDFVRRARLHRRKWKPGPDGMFRFLHTHGNF